MAKAKSAATKKSKKDSVASEVVVKDEPKSGVMDNSLMDRYKSMGGAGTENATQADHQVPMIYIAQTNSPCVDSSEDAYIEGIEIGDLYDTVNKEAIKEGLRIIPCDFRVRVLEWTPRDEGGGLVAIHDDRAILQKADDKDDRGRPMMDGHLLVETAEWVVLAEVSPGKYRQFMIPMASSNFRCSRTLMTMVGDYSPDWWDVVGQAPPSFLCSYMLTTEKRENKDGKWRAFTVVRGSECTGDEASRGELLHKLAKAGSLEEVGREDEGTNDSTLASPDGEQKFDDDGQPVPF